MQQIRQKRQTQRQEIRRQFLDNHFRQLRKRYLNYDNTLQHENTPNTHNQPSIFHMLLEQSLKHNGLALKLRQGNLMQQLNCLVDEAIRIENLYQKKYLITIISNMLQDQLKLHEKEDLLRLSIKLFDSLSISSLDIPRSQEFKHFTKVKKVLQPETLLYSMATANLNSQFLDEQDQIAIQQKIYPAFANVILFALEKPYEIASIEDFCDDARKFIRNIFDLAAQHYEQGNRLKAIRLHQFFSKIVKGHLWHLYYNNEALQNCFQNISIQFLWLYDKLTEYFDDLRNFFQNSQLFVVTEQTFKQNIKKVNSAQIKGLYSIWTTYIEKKMFLQQIQTIMTKAYGIQQFNGMSFVIKQISNSTELMYSAMDLVYSFCQAFFYEGQFKAIFQKFSISLVDMAVRALIHFEIQSMSHLKNRQFISKLISMVQLIIEKQNIQNTNGQKTIVNVFVSQGGMKILEQIQSWLMELDSSEDQKISEILASIEWILSQELQTQTYL